MDWFSPTGTLLREFGAKPAAPLLVFGAALILMLQPLAILRLSRPLYRATLLFALVFLSGSIAFLLNLLLSWARFQRSRDPVFQFVAQAALFLAFAFVVIVHARLFEHRKWRSYVLSALPAVVIIHLAVFLMEATSAVSHSRGWLSLFRTVGSSAIDRPSGLMSEPAYFGAFAALYGFPLLAIQANGKAPLRWILSGTLFAVAILIRAKTFVPVVLTSCVALMWRQGRAALRPKYIVGGAALLVISIFVIVSNAALDMQENLSSVMRIGSTRLALNVAGGGYGLTGIGFGQFQFFYTEKYAPSFLFASEEGLTQMSGAGESRASTYNFFVRLLVETGVLGISVFLLLLYQATRAVRRDSHPAALFGLLFVAGSVGFLCTQDSYFYPPLAVGVAILLGCADDPRGRANNLDIGSAFPQVCDKHV